MNPSFIRINQLASDKDQDGRIPLSKSSIWRLVRQGAFPAPVKLSAGCTAWRLADIEHWESSREATSAQDKDVSTKGKKPVLVEANPLRQNNDR